MKATAVLEGLGKRTWWCGFCIFPKSPMVREDTTLFTLVVFRKLRPEIFSFKLFSIIVKNFKFIMLLRRYRSS